MKRFILILAFSFLTLAFLTQPVLAARPSAPLAAPGFDLTPIGEEKWGLPNSVITYTLTVKNIGSDPDSFNIANPTGCSWNTWLSSNQISDLAPGATASFILYVAIPDNAATGASDVAAIGVSSATDAGLTKTATLTTRAVPPTSTPSVATGHPLVIIQSYSSNTDTLSAGQEFTLTINLANLGQSAASNVVVAFESADFLPRDTGGVQAISGLAAGTNVNISQPMLASRDLLGKSIGTITAKVSYLDNAGASFNETFSLTLRLKYAGYSGPAMPTATPTTAPKPKLIINSYHTDIEPLQPGTIFSLELEVQNQGNSEARGVTMILGGSSPMSSGEAGATQTVGGLSGGSSSLENFAPLDRSNIFFVGDLSAGSILQASQKLIVNVNTQPGAYPLKISFVYTDARGNQQIDDQIITLLVYTLPSIEVGFYRDTGFLMANQPNPLPLQVTNLGRKSTVLGNIKITAGDAEMQNNVTLIGVLESGGYFTLDPEVVPVRAGLLDLDITINYTDDFNQPRTITQKLQVNVQDMPTPSPEEMGIPTGAMMPAEANETFWQKVLRFLKGLVGLDSTAPQPVEEMPSGEPSTPLMP